MERTWGWSPRRPMAWASLVMRTREVGSRPWVPFGDAQDRLDDGHRDVAVEDGVVRPVDALLAALAKEVLDLVAAVGKG